MQSTSINLSTLKAYSMKSFPFGLIPWILSDQRLGRHGSWSRGERAMNGMCVTVRLSLQKCLLGLWKFMTPNGKQHVLKMVNFSLETNQRILFHENIPRPKIPSKFGWPKGGAKRRGSSGTIPCPSGRRLCWQLGGQPPATVTVVEV